VRARSQVIERRRRDHSIAAGHHIVLRGPGAGVQLVIEGIVAGICQAGLNLELYICGLRQREIDRYLTGGRVRGCSQALIAAVIRPLDVLTARGRRIILCHKWRKRALACQAFQFNRQRTGAA
jgi:hypothetical protein